METVDSIVGQRIRARRIAMGYSQAELGSAVGVRFQQVQKYESGANRVSASRLWAVAEFLKVHISYFFEGMDALKGDEDTAPAGAALRQDFLADRETVQMVEIFADLPSAQKRAVLALVKDMSAHRRPSPQDAMT
ncbi:Transcriptional regulator, contains XRE-family HTH domain [Cribrihabitans marinus]|uniref:Transcriptional regulator, contains XRE-family HTH domain n=1 Tax=Cribrihabitans marinus TaxID=1227549 RepID=A0A1H6VIJ3_9RHOB|nr:helix-turn-helix transcriptional regulator [Cribrihabitans marinus]SEJ00550.1 Transcriptional regulator, contains XRE-family HTH domain [Cribrihabitans marinus]